MKRISPWLILSILTPGVCEAYGYGYYCSTVRYSPYAFNYRNSGLVAAHVDYTPYALTYRNSGLVPGYGGCSGSYSSYGVSVASGYPRRIPSPASRAPRPAPRLAQALPQPASTLGGVDVIRGRLLAKGITSPEINRIFIIDNELVSADFFLKDRNLLIKYRNPRAIESLNAREEIKLKLYENYRQNWTQIAARHEQNGGEVYYIEASDAQMIVAALDSCPGLDAGPGVETQPVLYAKN